MMNITTLNNDFFSKFKNLSKNEMATISGGTTNAQARQAGRNFGNAMMGVFETALAVGGIMAMPWASLL